MIDNPYLPSETSYTTTRKRPVALIVAIVVAAVFAILWARAEYELYNLHDNNEKKDIAVMEWGLKHPEFAEYLNERISR